MSKPAPEPRLRPYRIFFREIEALYDLTEGRALQFTESGDPQMIFSVKDADGKSGWHYEDGRKVESFNLKELIHASIREDPGIALQRTFVRGRSRPIREKWVYVFACDESRSERARDAKERLPLHVLAFDKEGSFQFVKDGKRVGGKEEALTLEVDRRRSFFFYLAKWELTREAQERIGSDLRRRAVFLFNGFHLDVFDEKDARTARPYFIRELDKTLPASGKISCLLHLSCAISEAERRSAAYVEALERFEKGEEAALKDPEYALAKRVDLLTKMKGALRTNVAERLDKCLAKHAPRAAPQAAALQALCEDVVRWIGPRLMPHLRETPYRGDASVSQRLVVYEGKADKPDEPRRWESLDRNQIALLGEGCNAFRLAIRDYNYEGGSKEASDRALDIAATVHTRLADLPAGAEYMRRDLDEILKGFDPDDRLAAKSGPVDDYATSAKKKAEEKRLTPSAAAFLLKGQSVTRPVSQATGLILSFYGRFWAEKYQRKALSTLQAWMVQWLRIETDLDRVEYFGPKQIVAAARDQKRALNALTTKVEKLTLAHDSLDVLRKAGNVAGAVNCGLAWVTFFSNVYTLRERQNDPWAVTETIKATVDATKSTIALRAMEWSPALFKAAKAAQISKLGVAGGILSLLLGLRSFVETDDQAEKTGHFLSMTSGALSLASMLAAGMGVAAISGPFLLLTTTLLGIISPWVAEHLSAAAEFSRHCQFGNPEGTWTSLPASKTDRKSTLIARSDLPSYVEGMMMMNRASAQFVESGSEAALASHEKQRHPKMDEFWFTGEREKLKKDVALQHRALDGIIYNFQGPALDILYGATGDAKGGGGPDHVIFLVGISNPVLVDPGTKWRLSGTLTVWCKEGRTVSAPASEILSDRELELFPVVGQSCPWAGLFTRRFYGAKIKAIAPAVNSFGSRYLSAKVDGAALTITIPAGGARQEIEITRKGRHLDLSVMEWPVSLEVAPGL